MSNYTRSFHRQSEGTGVPRLRSQAEAEFEYREYQKRTNDKQVLAKKPTGSRVFKRSQHVEQRAQGAQQYQKQREAEKQAKRIPTAVRMTRAFGQQRQTSPVAQRAGAHAPKAVYFQDQGTFQDYSQGGAFVDDYDPMDVDE